MLSPAASVSILFYYFIIFVGFWRSDANLKFYYILCLMKSENICCSPFMYKQGKLTKWIYCDKLSKCPVCMCNKEKNIFMIKKLKKETVFITVVQDCLKLHLAWCWSTLIFQPNIKIFHICWWEEEEIMKVNKM